MSHSIALRPIRRIVRAGIQSIEAGVNLPRHQHLTGYVTLVLDGAYEQVSYAGRMRLMTGDILVQPSLDCHADTMLTSGLTLMRLPWRFDTTFGGVWRGFNLDEIRRVGERDAGEASQWVADLVDTHPPVPPVVDHWIDLLAADLAGNPRQRLSTWASAGGVMREAASRAFRRYYGTSPSAFRTEVRARAAVMRSFGSQDPLAGIAVEVGFNDQPHMTRAVNWLTGRTPGHWRRLAQDDAVVPFGRTANANLIETSLGAGAAAIIG